MRDETLDDLIDLGAASSQTLGLPKDRDEDFISETEHDA